MSEVAASSSELLATPEVLKLLSIGQTTLWRMEKQGTFPKALMLGRRCKRWRKSDIDAYIERMGAVG